LVSLEEPEDPTDERVDAPADPPRKATKPSTERAHAAASRF
jgi:hypothetical protein